MLALYLSIKYPISIEFEMLYLSFFNKNYLSIVFDVGPLFIVYVRL